VKDERGPWYLFTGFVLGIAIGLLYSWLLSPVEYSDAAPSLLRDEYKDHYRALVALAYLYNQDLDRAQARLDLLEDSNATQKLAEQAQRYLASGQDQHAAQALGLLAVDLERSENQETLPVTPSE
jgi:hypothetical protein